MNQYFWESTTGGPSPQVSSGQAESDMLPTMSVSTRYRITKRDLAATWDAIKQVGYEDALELAFAGSLAFLEKEPENPLATNYLSWSCNLLADSRTCKEADQHKMLTLSRFYRTVAHRVYWRQREQGSIGQIPDFLQLAPVAPVKK